MKPSLRAFEIQQLATRKRITVSAFLCSGSVTQHAYISTYNKKQSAKRAERQEVLLKQQQELTKNVILKQQQWMEAMMKRGTVAPSGSTSDQQMVPAFHNFNKECHNCDSYLEQLNEHFSAYVCCHSCRKTKIYFPIVDRY